ncbi:MAG: energy transducer TonB [Bacteroidales bacterium]|jgi:colicin import membrane protein|nr:energy transducer TonB [Bacteroidales bacterium]
MSQETKDKVKAWFGTILFHALLILALFFLALKTPLPLPDEEGVEVNLGYSDVGQNIQQIQPEEIPAPTPQPVQEIVEEVVEDVIKEVPDEEIIEEDTEEAPTIAKKPEPKKETEKKVEQPIEKPIEEKKPEPEKKIEQPKEVVKKKEPEPEPKPVVDTRLMYTGKKEGASSEGNDQQQGDKGVESGVLNTPKYSGPGGLGSDGISYNLGNRKASSLPKPSYNSDDQGRVNVRIRVDKSGRVISAEIFQKGTTVSDINLHNMAVQAALKAIFAPDSNAPEIQVGTITYNFIKLN